MTQRSSGLAPGPRSMAHSFLFSKGGAASWYGQAKSQGQGHQQRPWGWHCCPSKPRKDEHGARDYSWHLLSNGSLALLGFASCLGPSIPFFFLIFSFWNGNVHPMLSHYCIWEGANSLVLRTKRSLRRAIFQGVTNSLTWLSTAAHARTHTHTYTHTHTHTRAHHS